MHVLMGQTGNLQEATISGTCADAQGSYQNGQRQEGERCNVYASQTQSHSKQIVYGQISVHDIQTNGNYENRPGSRGLVEKERKVHGRDGTRDGNRDDELTCESLDEENKENVINNMLGNGIVNENQTNQPEVKGSLSTSAKSGLSRTSPELSMKTVRMENGATNYSKRQDVVSRVPAETESALTIQWDAARPGPNHQSQVRHITMTDVEQNKRYSRYKHGGNSDTEPLVSVDISDLNLTNCQSQEAKKILMDIMYPHEYYDTFSRVGRRKIPIRKPDVSTFPRPTKIVRKFGEQDTNKPIVVADRTYARTKLPSRKDESSGDVSNQNSDKWRRDEDGSRRDVHVNCRSKHSSVVIMDDTDGQKLAVSGLKGWLLKREDNGKTKLQKDVKTSPYEISSLGMRFNLPEYNGALHTRRPLTGVLAPTSVLNPASTRPYTHVHSTRQNSVFEPSSFQKMLKRGSSDIVQTREKTMVQRTVPSQDVDTFRSHMQPYAGINTVGYSKHELRMSPISSEIKSYNLHQSKTFL